MATLSPQHARAFATLVANTSKCLVVLVDVLEEEQKALAQHAPAALESVLPRKQRVLAELQPLVQGRDQLQQALGLPPGIAGGDQLLGSLPADSPPAKAWARLRELSIRVEALNRQNGQLVQHGQKAARMALGILTGRHNEPGLYGRRGKDKSRLAGQSLGTV